MKAPFFDLKHQYASIRDEINRAIQDVLEEQQFILGKSVESFETEFAQYGHTGYAIGVSSGTDAILLALMASGITNGDEVITSPYTFIAGINCIIRLGAKPVFVDIDPRTFNLDPNLIEMSITERTRAIMPVHLFGQMAEMESICTIAANHDLLVIEDAAQSLGAMRSSQQAGTFGVLGCFSFFPTKNLGAFGDGGMVTTHDPLIHAKLIRLRTQGQSRKYFSEMAGGNFRLDAIQAKILSIKLKYLDKWIECRRQNAKRYNHLLGDLTKDDILTFPFEQPSNFHTYNQYVIRVNAQRDGLKSYLEEHGIGCEVYYPVPAHLQPVCAGYNYAGGMFPIAEKVALEALALPIYPELSEDLQVYISTTIHNFFEQAL